jgi:hypothetical protein
VIHPNLTTRRVPDPRESSWSVFKVIKSLQVPSLNLSDCPGEGLVGQSRSVHGKTILGPPSLLPSGDFVSLQYSDRRNRLLSQSFRVPRRLHVLFERKKQPHAIRWAIREFDSGKRSVQKIGESGNAFRRIVSQVPESHGPVGKEAMLRCSAQKYLKVFVSVVFFDAADEFHHGFLIAFEDLQKGAILVEK